MSAEKTETVLKIVRKDPRYGAQAYYFIFDALDFTLQRIDKRRHVTGRELLEGIRLFATEHFGFLAKTVLNEWGLTCTQDFGEIVFNLVEAGLLSRTEKDTREDFADVFDFDVAFDAEFRRSLSKVTLPEQ
jgi:uncharacterized repeat protein (TIGR04138 family)